MLESLLPFKSTKDDRIDSYCPKLECEFSSNYTDTFYIAYLHYKNTGLNLSPFRFGGGTPSTNQQSKHL